jgi:hypothetical protein
LLAVTHHSSIHSHSSTAHSLSLSGDNSLPPPTQTIPSSTTTTDQRIQNLLTHPAMSWNSTTTFASMHKKKLGKRHLSLFDNRYQVAAAATATADHDLTTISTATTTRQEDDYLFNEFASAICHANVIPRKEVFETWSAALHIHHSFFGDNAPSIMMTNNNDDDWNVVVPIRRVVDVAAGHGLLAWALLLLDDEYQEGNRGSRGHPPPQQPLLPPLTAFCLDLHMPPSATLIHSSMIQHFSNLESRVEYVEGRLEQLVPHPTCLLASVHGCGILTDMLVATAAEHQVPLAVVPCCHSRKPIVLEVASPYAKDEYEGILLNNDKDKRSSSIPNLADRLDQARMTALRNAGLEVKEVYLPQIFTDKNRLILGFPSTTTNTGRNSQKDCAPSSFVTIQPSVKPAFTTRGNNMPPLNNHHISANDILRPKPRYMKGLYIPCQDSLTHRQLITQLSGKEAADTRKKVMHNRSHTKYPQLDVSLWLPNDDIVSEEALSLLISEMNHKIQCTVTRLGEMYVHPASGRKAQTFRIQYSVSPSSSDDGNIKDEEVTNITDIDADDILSFEDAKRIHLQLCETIPISIPGAECR